MAGLNSDYTGFSILIYDMDGCTLGKAVVSKHNIDRQLFELQDTFPVLNTGDKCRILILSSPSPFECFGKFIRHGVKTFIAVYNGREKENRKAVRYSVDSPALVEHLIYNGRAYPLLNPLKISLINISKSGVRFTAPFGSLSDGARFQMSMPINNNNKLLIADVINHIDSPPESSEYGCRFLIGGDR